jgi:rhamnogalacturonyl hydrolase YesR
LIPLSPLILESNLGPAPPSTIRHNLIVFSQNEVGMMMPFILIAVTIISGCVSDATLRQRSAADTAGVMKKVADWQLAHPMHDDTDWKNGVMYAGIMAAYQTTREKRYLEALMAMGDRNGWRLGPELRLADDHCIGQTYIELYLVNHDPKMIENVRETFDTITATPRPGRVDWFWCDSLFMAPAVMARLSAATQDPKYLDLMDAMWWDTTDFLYDRQEHLFFRDENFFAARERNGAKVFWSRGNGWVLAGLIRVLQYMPEDYPSRGKYLSLYRDMAAKLVSLQSPDGFWRSSLLDPQSYPGGESSGTALFTYAIAWGVNNHVLSADVYSFVADRGWKALVGAVDESGKVGWVQKPDDRPRLLQKPDSETYGTGAFLLAGSEMLNLYSKK